MKNVDITYSADKKKATFVVDLTKEFGPSQSGKTIIIASTEGNVPLEGGAKLGLNVYRGK